MLEKTVKKLAKGKTDSFRNSIFLLSIHVALYYKYIYQLNNLHFQFWINVNLFAMQRKYNESEIKTLKGSTVYSKNAKVKHSTPSESYKQIQSNAINIKSLWDYE